MNREQLIKSLNFFAHEMVLPSGQKPEFGTMDAALAPVPEKYDSSKSSNMGAVTKYFHGESDVDMLDSIITEIQADISWLSKTYGTLNSYGVFFYKVPVEDTERMISFARVADISCDTAIGCSHLVVAYRKP